MKFVFFLSFLFFNLCVSDSCNQDACPNYYPYYPQTYDCFQYFCNQWYLQQPGTGIINFQANSSDLYIAIFDEVNTNNFIYMLYIGDSGIELIASNCNISFSDYYYTIPNLQFRNNYQIVFNKSTSSITVNLNGTQIYYIVETHYCAVNSKYVSFSN